MKSSSSSSAGAGGGGGAVLPLTGAVNGVGTVMGEGVVVGTGGGMCVTDCLTALTAGGRELSVLEGEILLAVLAGTRREDAEDEDGAGACVIVCVGAMLDRVSAPYVALAFIVPLDIEVLFKYTNLQAFRTIMRM